MGYSSERDWICGFAKVINNQERCIMEIGQSCTALGFVTGSDTEFEFHVESTVCSEVTVNMLTWKRSIIAYSMVKKFAKIVFTVHLWYNTEGNVQGL